MKYYIETFGCAMNQADGQFLQETLQEAGYISSASPFGVNIIILNTCTVRGSTEGKMISRLKFLDAIAEATDLPKHDKKMLMKVVPVLEVMNNTCIGTITQMRSLPKHLRKRLLGDLGISTE